MTRLDTTDEWIRTRTGIAAAPEVAHRLGLGQVPAFDVSAGTAARP